MKPRVLMIAYACDPAGSGEHWLGWGWAEQAAHKYEVDLITTPKARAAVQEGCQSAGITAHFIELPSSLKKASEAVRANWLRKLAWQKRAARLASDLHRQKKFQLVHQTTFHSFRVPFLAACRLGIPSVWGPIAGGESVPPGFERYLGGARFGEAVRKVVNRLWLHAPAVHRSLKHASVIFVSNRVTKDFLPAEFRSKCETVSPNALRAEDERQNRPPERLPTSTATLKLLYVGNCVPTRALPIVFEALRQSGLTDYELSIIGDGPAAPAWRTRAEEMGLQGHVKFAGRIPRSQLDSWYAGSDALVFPALRDSGGSALLEAMARFLPVICLDWAGPGEMVDTDSGLKIPVTDPQACVSAFGQALTSLAREPSRRATLAAAARIRAEKLFRWQSKRDLLESTYTRLIAPR